MVAREADVRDFAALSAVVAELGCLDVVVAAAGICSAGLSWELSLEQWQETIDVNLTGVLHTAEATLPVPLQQGTGGSITITSSVAGLRRLPFPGAYVASEHGVVGLARTMADELGRVSRRPRGRPAGRRRPATRRSPSG